MVQAACGRVARRPDGGELGQSKPIGNGIHVYLTSFMGLEKLSKCSEERDERVVSLPNTLPSF